MNDKAREFLEKLADLMDEYYMICVVNSYYPNIEGVRFSSKFPNEWDIELPEAFNANRVRNLIGDTEPPELFPGTRDALAKLSIRGDSGNG